MKTRWLISLLFAIAALYDAVLGLAFLVAGERLFDWSGVTPPNHPGYIQFPAALLLIFAALFAAIAAHPVRRRNQILYGVLLKLSYCGVVSYHWITVGVPWIWKPFCIADLVFLLLFLWAWALLRMHQPTEKRLA